MHPILVDLGFFQLPTYGVMLVVALVVALITLKKRADRSGLDGARVVDVGLWLVIWALVGSKVLLVLVELPRFIRDPAELIVLIRAGGVFLGGFLAAVIAAVVLLRRHRMEFLPTVDVIAPSLALGHAIGRVGCLMAGCCWGARCDLPWAVEYTDPRAHELVGTPLGVHLHPSPVYESLFNLVLYAGLAALYRRRPTPGKVFAAYLTAYGVGRFLLEYTRGDTARGFVLSGALSTSQAIALGMVAVGISLFAWAARRGR